MQSKFHHFEFVFEELVDIKTEWKLLLYKGPFKDDVRHGVGEGVGKKLTP